MNPKKVLQWMLVGCAAWFALLAVFYGTADVYMEYTQEFPLLRRILDTDKADVVDLVGFALAAFLATFVVAIFGVTRGSLAFSALGIRFTGPSGPVLLWCVTFAVIMAALRSL